MFLDVHCLMDIIKIKLNDDGYYFTGPYGDDFIVWISGEHCYGQINHHDESNVIFYKHYSNQRSKLDISDPEFFSKIRGFIDED